MATEPTSAMSFLDMRDESFLARLAEKAKFKPRSHATYYSAHLPELNHRLSLGLGLDLPEPITDVQDIGVDTSTPTLSNMSKMEVVYLGNSMLERLKTTGKDTRLATLQSSWNAGCGGDTTENILYRLSEGMYDILKTPHPNKHIKIWLLVSGTNNLRPKKPFRERDVESWRLLVEACFKMAPTSKVLAVGMFYRKDVLDEVVEQSNDMLRQVVEQVNEGLVKNGWGERVQWVKATDGRVTMDMLDDHVHLNEEGYQIFDEALFPLIQKALGEPEQSKEEMRGEETAMS
ncbi:SGNH hydrolase-type esterase domain-containing protein [Lophiotrema nucula]|uniref:SGNH hydrolase-type esterase domain-containing protein n=1 Tax=Lophiotrema nucula TaxID=690887 RepID=A0A6A5Z8V6_9PLEO|nr:SGNH hydrolase-type esterase domain-containing protein [Lophiotrema nucula]